jgi:hypothetical protein
LSLFEIVHPKSSALSTYWSAVFDRADLLLFGGIALAVSASAVARGNVVFAGGAWTAIDRGIECEALSRSQKVVARDKVQPVAGFTFSPDHRRWGEFHARLSRMPRGDATVMLKVGDQPFLLVTRSGWAWSTGPMQADAIIAAVRGGGWMQVESRDGSGARFSDPYLLDGAPTAIDAAAARCALRGAGKIQ